MQWMSIRPIRAACAFSKAGFRRVGAGQVVLREAVPAPTAVPAALRFSEHLSGPSAVAHAVLRSMSSRAAVINPRKEAGATADVPLRSPVAGGGGCGSAVAGAPSMLAKQEQKAIDELADMSIVDEVRRPAAVLPAAAAVNICVDLRCARRRLCPFTCEGHTVQSPVLASPLSRVAFPRLALRTPAAVLRAHAQDDDDGSMGWTNPETGEVGGPKGSLRGAEPTRFGDWEQNG